MMIILSTGAQAEDRPGLDEICKWKASLKLSTYINDRDDPPNCVYKGMVLDLDADQHFAHSLTYLQVCMMALNS